MNWSSKNFLLPLSLAFLLIMVSAFAQTGGSPTPTPSGSPSVTPSPSASATPLTTSREVFVVTLSTANVDPLFGAASGFGRFTVDGDSFGAYLQLSGLAPGMMHEQTIHGGTQCPTFAADTNGDAFIDAVESDAVTGPPILALGLDPGVSANVIASAKYPVPADDGVTTYISGALLSAIGVGNVTPSPTMSPTQTPSASPSTSASPSSSPTASPSATPNATATTASELLSNLEGHVVIIHGVSPDTALPSTAASDQSLSPTAALPVACGILTRAQE
jgi:hypothetical protein